MKDVQNHDMHKSFHDKQKDTYKSLAGTFDEDQKRDNRNHFNKITAINDHLEIKPGDKVLEIGIGTGIHASYLFDLNKNIDFAFYGVDLSDDMLKVSGEKLKNKKKIKLMSMAGENLEFKDGSFDKVYISGSLHHFEDPYKGILEILRVLKPGGKFCIMEPNYFFPTNLRAAHFTEEEVHMRLMKRKNFKRWFRQAQENYKFEFNIKNFAYTPPFPKSLIPLFNKIDRIIHQIPVLRRLSVMLFISGRKQ